MCIFYMLRKMAPPKTTRSKTAKWEDAHVDFMLALYVEKYLHTERGNLGTHHWQYIVDTSTRSSPRLGPLQTSRQRWIGCAKHTRPNG